MAVNDHIALAATDVGDTGRLKPHVIEKLNFPEPDRQPFSRLTSNAGTIKVPRMEFLTQEEWDVDFEIGVTAETTGTTEETVAVDDSGALTVDTVMMVVGPDGRPTGEQVLANTITSATSIECTRGWGGTAATIPSGSTLKVLDIVRSESDDAPAVKMRATNRDTQYCGWIARSLEVSYVMQKSQMYGVKEEARVDGQGMRAFARNVERMLKFGMEKVDTTTSTKTFWHPRGIRDFALEHNRFECNGSLSYDTFVGGIQQANRHGGVAEKFLFCSNALAAGISKWPVNHDIARQEAARETFGFNVDTLLVPGLAGKVHVVVDYDLEDVNEMLLVDMRGAKIAEFCPLTVDKGAGGKGIQTPGTYTMKWQFYRAVGLACSMPWAQGIFTGVDRVVV